MEERGRWRARFKQSAAEAKKWEEAWTQREEMIERQVKRGTWIWRLVSFLLLLLAGGTATYGPSIAARWSRPATSTQVPVIRVPDGNSQTAQEPEGGTLSTASAGRDAATTSRSESPPAALVPPTFLAPVEEGTPPKERLGPPTITPPQ